MELYSNYLEIAEVPLEEVGVCRGFRFRFPLGNLQKH